MRGKYRRNKALERIARACVLEGAPEAVTIEYGYACGIGACKDGHNCEYQGHVITIIKPTDYFPLAFLFKRYYSCEYKLKMN